MEPPQDRDGFVTAMVVNDDLTQLNIQSGLLRREGFNVTAYSDAEKALAALAADNPPGLIITDLYMPGIDGWQFCRLLRSPEYERCNQIPILVVSATFSGDEASRITADLGADAFLPSPVDGRQFTELVRALARRERQRELVRVLIVEDSRTLAALLKKTFASHGYQTDTALSGKEAVDRFKRTPYDVVVLDYHLPDIQGDLLLVDFRRERPESVIIMMTTDPQPGLAVAWMKDGASAYVRKPFEMAYLIELCAKARRERALLRVEDLLESRTRELRQSEARLRNILENLNDVVYALDPSGTVTYVSPNVESLVGRRPVEIVGKSFLDFIHPDDVHARMPRFQKVLAGEAVASEYRFLTRQHKTIWVSTHARPSFENGRISGLQGVLVDITERKRFETARLEMDRRKHQIEKAESISRMAGAVAHNFNNMLAAVIGNLELAMDDLAPGTDVAENITEARQAARRAAETSELMLTFLGQSYVEPKTIDWSATCGQCLEHLRAKRPDRITLKTDLPVPGPVVDADPDQMDQVLTHLVANAWEAVGDSSGEVRVAIESVDAAALPELNRFPVGWTPSASAYACLLVSDTGRGMHADTVQKIFDPFYTDKFTGRGLGLAVSLGIVKSFAGCITVESHPGKGSIFRVFLSRSDEAVLLPDEEKALNLPAGPGGRTVLLVEDEEIVRKMTRAMLEHLGFDILEAVNGAEAVALFKKHSHCICLVLSDLSMPHKDGWQTLAALRRIQPAIPVVLASGYDQARALAGNHPEQPQAFLHKPFEMKALVDALRKALTGAPVPD